MEQQGCEGPPQVPQAPLVQVDAVEVPQAAAAAVQVLPYCPVVDEYT
jgi:hypothetical protein